MTAPVVYDISRLLLRSFAPGPNGIDRIDLNLARHFLSAPANRGIILNKLRPVAVRDAGALVDRVAAAWNEDRDPADDPVYLELRDRLISGTSRTVPHERGRRALSRGHAGMVLEVLRQLHKCGLTIPRHATFIHATQFPSSAMFRWLDGRPDVASVFFVHDLLPLRHPEWFTERNAEEHRKFLDVLVRYARAAIVNTRIVRDELRALFKARGARQIPILAEAMPAAPVFAAAEPADAELRAVPYFVICGTIEPRKNHRLLLTLWERLAQSEGPQAPKLVIAGRRGWNNADVFAQLDSLSPHSAIIEASGLSTAGLARIMANACALLMPSLAEGYGLPIIEALAAGTPVIASDIPVFREVGGERVTYCDPRDPESWRKAITAHVPPRDPGATGQGMQNDAAWTRYYGRLEAFVADPAAVSP